MDLGWLANPPGRFRRSVVEWQRVQALCLEHGERPQVAPSSIKDAVLRPKPRPAEGKPGLAGSNTARNVKKNQRFQGIV
jgi:hypothetical protein